MITTPPFILLDTNHWIEIAAIRRGESGSSASLPERRDAYRLLYNWLRQGRWLPVTTIEQSFEWRRNDNVQGALEIARTIDGAISVYDVAPALTTYMLEVLGECQRQSAQRHVDLPPIRQPLNQPNHAMVFFRRHYGGDVPVPDAWRQNPIPYHVSSVEHRVLTTIRALHEEDRLNPAWLDGIQAVFAEMKAQRAGHRGFNRASRLEYLDRILGLRGILSTFQKGTLVQSLDHVNLANCRAFDLGAAVYWQFVQGRPQIVENDIGDLSLLHVIPYASFSLLEKGLWGLIQNARPPEAARTFRRPEDLVAKLTPLIG